MKISFLRNHKGAAAIEFAIILPLLIVLVFGIIEFSLILFDKAMITNASREGARAGIVYRWPAGLTTAEIQTVVNQYLQNHLISLGGSSTASIQVSGAQGLSGNPLTVTVDYQYRYLVLPGFISALGGAINLRAQTVMRME